MWDVSAFMKLLKQRFTQWFNRRHRRKGTLWEERFKSVLVEGSHQVLATMAAYIDLNPVRARLVEDPGTGAGAGMPRRWRAGGGPRRPGRAGRDAPGDAGSQGFGPEPPSAVAEGKALPCQTLERYRVWLFGQGERIEAREAIPVSTESGSLPVETRPGRRGGIAPERMAEVVAGRGKLTRW